MYNNCRRCGIDLKGKTNKLRCKKCSERVDEELNGETQRTFGYYFKWYIKMKGKKLN